MTFAVMKFSTLKPIAFFPAYSLTPIKCEPDAPDTSAEVLSPKKWQREMFEALAPKQYRSITTPTGSGKSVGVVMLACRDRDNGQKVLVSVPQTIIASSFRTRKIQLPDGSVADWCPRNNPEDATIAGQVQTVVDFVLDAVPVTPALRSMLCTHQALVLAFARISAMNLGVDSWKGTSLFLDEAHHTKVSDDEDETEELESQNKLGGVAKHYLENNSAPLTMITATWGRTDSQILPEAEFKKFERYYLSVYDYLARCQYLQTVEQRFVTGAMLATTEHLLEAAIGKKIMLFLPRMGTPEMPSIEAKHTLLRKLLKRIHKNPKLKQQRLLDLVTQEGRDARLLALRKAIASKDAQALPDIIISLNIGTEGFDYPELEYVVQMAPRGSFIEAQQMQGRLLRDVPGKGLVRTDTVLPTERGKVPDGNIRNWLKVLITSMITDLQFYTVRLKRDKTAADLVLDSAVAGKVLSKVAELAIAHEGNDLRIEEGLNAFLVEELSTEQPKLLAPGAAPALVSHIRSFFGAKAKLLAAELDLDLELKEELLAGDFGIIRFLSCQLGHKSLKEFKERLARLGPPFTCADIRFHISAFFQKHGCPPCSKGGRIEGDPYKRLWSAISQAVPDLFGCTFAELLRRDYGRSRKLPFTREEIEGHINAFIKKHGTIPKHSSGRIEGDLYGRKWSAIGQVVPSLFGCTFVELLRRDYGGSFFAPLWTEKERDRVVLAYIVKHGKTPSPKDELIEGDLTHRKWGSLIRSHRKLFGCTFAEYLRKKHGRSRASPPWTKKERDKAIPAFIKKHGKPPGNTSGPIEGDPYNRTWEALFRMHPKLFGESLIKLLRRDYGRSLGPPQWTEKEIHKVIRRHFKKYGTPPGTVDGHVLGDPYNRTWSSIDTAATKLLGCSLSKLLCRDYGGSRGKYRKMKREREAKRHK